MKALGIGLFAVALAFLATVWWQGFAAPPGLLYDARTEMDEAAYCLAVAERISEITGGRGEAKLERHLDEQVDFWRPRAGPRSGAGRAALARQYCAGRERRRASASGGTVLRNAGGQVLRPPLRQL